MKEKSVQGHPLYQLLAKVDQTYANLPQKMRLDIERISQSLTDFGPRKLHRRGQGMEFFEAREFRSGADDPRKINARLSAREGKLIVIDREAEIRQHFYLWRDATPSMDFKSVNVGYTKKQAAEVMLLAFAKHLARNEDAVGVLDGKGMHYGSRAAELIASKLYDVSIAANDMPVIQRQLPKNSTVILFSDFLAPPEDLAASLGRINGMGLKGYVVMVLDPQELDFEYKGHVKFRGLEGEGTQIFKKAQSIRDPYQKEMKAHIERVQKLCKAKGFNFILQRTDEPLYKGLLAIYGLSASMPAQSLVPER